MQEAEYFMEIAEYIKPELLIVALALYFLEAAVRKSAVIQEKYILLLTGAAGIVICSLYVFATCECGGGKDIAMAAFTAVTQGIVVAGISTYAKQIVSQIGKK